MSAFSAVSLTFSPSCTSMARRTFPSRLELNSRFGSLICAPLANVNLTTLLYVSPVQMIRPSWYQTGTPLHLHSSTTLGTVCFMILWILESVSPGQSPSSLILSSMIFEGYWLLFASVVFFILLPGL